MRDARAINLLKLRASYGVNGNNGIAAYRAYGLYGTSIYNGVTGYRPTQLENRVLSWERNLTTNFGLDFGFFNNRLTGNIDVYNRLTKDMLLTKQIPQTSGFSSIFTNLGSMVNGGGITPIWSVIRRSTMLPPWQLNFAGCLPPELFLAPCWCTTTL